MSIGDARDSERPWIVAMLLITTAMGMLDAISLLHLGTFTGYVTGTVILIGVTLAQGAALAAPPLVALGALLVGALAGGRLVRRGRSRHRLVADLLGAVAVLIGLAAALDGLAPPETRLGLVALLAFAMGLQTSATRHAAIPDMTMPAATMVLHGLAHDSRLAGGGGQRSWRRTGVLAGLLVGAAAGTALSAWHVWAGLLATASVVMAAALVLRLRDG